LLKKILIFIIIFVIAVTIFTACTDDKTDDTQTTIATTFSSGDEIAPVQESDEIDEIAGIKPHLPDYDWGGYKFKILSSGSSSSHDVLMWNTRDITAEAETGDPINDAVYRRNKNLEEKYNFTIEEIISKDLRIAVMAGDNYFDVVSLNFSFAVTAAQEGLLVDLFTIDYLDFTQPWWDQSLVNDLSICNKLFFASGDCVLKNRDSILIILFNKQMLGELNLENPYDFVRDGKWTIGKLSEMAKVAALDLNGNGKMDLDDDRFGFIIQAANNSGLPRGAGVRYASKDNDGLPVLTYGSERDFNVASALYDFGSGDFIWDWLGEVGFINGNDSPVFGRPERTFAEGRGLFIEAYVRTIENLRGMETDFGILPMPWLDEHQGQWYHSIEFGGSNRAVPIFHTDDDLERIGFMLEAMAEESHYTVIPAHYERQLQGKFIRDDESGEMLDIIFGSVVWDPGKVYGWINNDMRGLTSDLERYLGVIEGRMQKTIDAFANIK